MVKSVIFVINILFVGLMKLFRLVVLVIRELCLTKGTNMQFYKSFNDVVSNQRIVY